MLGNASLPDPRSAGLGRGTGQTRRVLPARSRFAGRRVVMAVVLALLPALAMPPVALADDPPTRDDALDAIRDYFDGKIPWDQASEVVDDYYDQEGGVQVRGVPPVQAQGTEGVLVSNIGQAVSSGSSLINSHGQAFTTGANSGGYTLTSVDIRFASPTNSSVTVRVTTGGARRGRIREVVAVLSDPTSFGIGNLTFTAPANTTLSANTTYQVTVSGSAGTLSLTNSGAEDSAAAGWSIANEGLFKSGSLAWQSSTSPRMISVKGYCERVAGVAAVVRGRW